MVVGDGVGKGVTIESYFLGVDKIVESIGYFFGRALVKVDVVEGNVKMDEVFVTGVVGMVEVLGVPRVAGVLRLLKELEVEVLDIAGVETEGTVDVFFETSKAASISLGVLVVEDVVLFIAGGLQGFRGSGTVVVFVEGVESTKGVEAAYVGEVDLPAENFGIASVVEEVDERSVGELSRLKSKPLSVSVLA